MAPFTTTDVAAARAASRGAVLLPGEPGFSAAHDRLFNRMFADRVPAVVFQPVGATDVAVAVKFARAHALPLACKCGGHHGAGRSAVAGGVLVDLCRINNVFVDAKAGIVHAGGGCLLRDVDCEAGAHGLAVVLGAYPQTGVGGLALHGGVGLLSAQHGLAADNILEVEVVTADGRIVVANADQHADLFFAARGLAGYFGIVTRIAFRAHPIAPTIYGGIIVQPMPRIAPHVAALRALTATDRHLGAYIFMANSPNGPIAMTMCGHTHPDPAVAKATVDQFANIAPVAAGGYATAPYWKVNASFGDVLHANPPPPSRQYWRPFVVEAAKLADPTFVATVQAAVDLVFSSPATPATLVVFEPWNRGIADHPNATPLCNVRGDLLMLAFVVSWLETQPDEPALAVVAQVTELLSPHALDRNYVNYVGSLDAAKSSKVGRALASDELRTKVRAIKAEWDPTAVFGAI